MSDAATLGVIRDLFAVAALALLIAAPFYAVLRRRSDTTWNYEGNVLARSYNWLDAFVALSMVALLFFPMASPQATSQPLTNPSSASETSSVYVLLMNTVFMLIVTFIILAYLRVVRDLNPAELFGMRQMTVGAAFLRALGALLITYILMLGVKYVVEEVFYAGKFPDPSSQETVEVFQKDKGFAFRALLGVAAVFVAPVVEETMFRGFLYGVIKRLTDRWFSVCFTSLLFAIVHHHVGSIVPLFVLALGFTTAYEATGCLLVPIFMHALFNAWNIALLAIHPS
jgi:membrane protease YdiL (CAAX protease family)